MHVLSLLASIYICTFAASGATGCGWTLDTNDCICMNSVDGSLMKVETSACCKSMGYKTANSICGVDKDNRQNFKDCCKDLEEESVIGHCR
ncbi:hypothetical protein QBC46DRAFT_366374 [Diplogelasinospora grovesii]|uniref:Extracellular membrane protein CFEM domain-containing protein n=1 Tax=Diplogelasinospora grovesii TaxID=303347 RepID=A0AAN6N4D6_9PEZI|nr:hypothetical protein QBC46DRAFT_366374 [Diplogelasinospora grovesii]